MPHVVEFHTSNVKFDKHFALYPYLITQTKKNSKFFKFYCLVRNIFHYICVEIIYL
jgi:hypothetical protein